jgi:hypothetical protein
MLKAVYKPLDKLGKSLVQVLNLCALSTGLFSKTIKRRFLSRFDNTVPAQKPIVFAQPKMPVFNLLSVYLYPSSTAPITNTKLNIKELYS